MTDIDGNYVLSGVPEGSTLVFTYLGFKPKEVNAISTSLNVVMESDNELLDEVVVIGYGQQRKVTLTGSVCRTAGCRCRYYGYVAGYCKSCDNR